MHVSVTYRTALDYQVKYWPGIFGYFRNWQAKARNTLVIRLSPEFSVSSGIGRTFRKLVLFELDIAHMNKWVCACVIVPYSNLQFFRFSRNMINMRFRSRVKLLDILQNSQCSIYPFFQPPGLVYLCTKDFLNFLNHFFLFCWHRKKRCKNLEKNYNESTWFL